MTKTQIAHVAQFVFIALAALAVYMFVGSAQDGEARAACTPLCALHPSYANQNRTIPDFELSDLDGRRVRFSSFRGKTVILNFWTKACRPCLEEMPSLADLGQVLKPQTDIVLVTVSTDLTQTDIRATLQAVLGDDKPPFLVLLDPESKVVRDTFGTTLYPETWFIDPDGVIRIRVDGARDWSSPLALNVTHMISRKSGCEIAFDAGKPHGKWSEICENTGVTSSP